MRALFINIGILIFAIFVNLLVNESVYNQIVDKILFNSISVFVGISIAVIGIFLGSINHIYVSIFQVLNQDEGTTKLTSDEIWTIKGNLDGVAKELKDNTIFSLSAFVATVVLIILKPLDIPYVTWFIDPTILTKPQCLNIAITLAYGLIIHAVIDTCIVIFKVSGFFRLTKH